MPSTNTPKKSPKKSLVKASNSPPKNVSPTRREYKPINDAWSFGKLPFVHRPKHGLKTASNWKIPPTNDYGAACNTGCEYAGHYLQYIKDNPQACGSNALGAIASDIDFKDASNAKGYWVGFFSYIERVLYAQVHDMNVFEEIDRVNSAYTKIIAKRVLKQKQR
jgi:hypothetical protein